MIDPESLPLVLVVRFTPGSRPSPREDPHFVPHPPTTSLLLSANPFRLSVSPSSRLRNSRKISGRFWEWENHKIEIALPLLQRSTKSPWDLIDKIKSRPQKMTSFCPENETSFSFRSFYFSFHLDSCGRAFKSRLAYSSLRY